MVAVALQPVTFTCITRNSGILEWSSREYIEDGNIIQLFSINCVGTNTSSSNNLAVATCKEISYDHGVEIIESELYLEALLQFPTSTVTCTSTLMSGSTSALRCCPRCGSHTLRWTWKSCLELLPCRTAWPFGWNRAGEKLEIQDVRWIRKEITCHSGK